MASNTHVQHYADGTSQVVRRKKQGRPLGSGEGRRPYSYTASDDGQAIIVAKAKRLNMTVSQFVEHAAILYQEFSY